jgi:hypothetical protein
MTRTSADDEDVNLSGNIFNSLVRLDLSAFSVLQLFYSECQGITYKQAMLGLLLQYFVVLVIFCR